MELNDGSVNARSRTHFPLGKDILLPCGTEFQN